MFENIMLNITKVELADSILMVNSEVYDIAISLINSRKRMFWYDSGRKERYAVAATIEQVADDEEAARLLLEKSFAKIK